MASERQRDLKHGLTSSTLVVLPEEDRQEYDELLRGFRESLQPEGGIEEALVLRLAQAHWRSLRSRCVETGMLHLSAKLQRHQARRLVEDCPEHLNLHEAIGVGFMVMPAERWQMYLRYDAASPETSSERSTRSRASSAFASPREERNCPIPGFGPFRKMTQPAAGSNLPPLT